MRGSAARLLLAALVVLALVAVVAIAATGQTETGTGDSRPPADTLMDIFISTWLVGVAMGGILFLYDSRARWRATYFLGQLDAEDVRHDLERLAGD